MAIRFSIDGIDVSTDTADEAAALIKRLRATQAQPAKPQRAVAADVAPQSPVKPLATEIHPPVKAYLPLLALEFLRSIKAAGPMGADTDRMLRAVQAAHPKGIGSKAAMINDYLRAKHGFASLDEVYVRARGPLGRVWTAGPRLDDAMTAVQEVIDSYR